MVQYVGRTFRWDEEENLVQVVDQFDSELGWRYVERNGTGVYGRTHWNSVQHMLLHGEFVAQ